MDIEWLLDGKTEEIYIIQVRPETVHSEKGDLIEEYHMEEKSEVILRGTAIGEKIGSGKANVLKSPKNMDQFEEGDILVTDMTDPDWEPIMKKASGIITNKGGRTYTRGNCISRIRNSCHNWYRKSHIKVKDSSTSYR